MNVWSSLLNFALCHLWGIYTVYSLSDKRLKELFLVFIKSELLTDKRPIKYVPQGKVIQFLCM